MKQFFLSVTVILIILSIILLPASLSVFAGESSSFGEDIKVTWTLVSNYPDEYKCTAAFDFTNMGDKTLGDNWTLYFNQDTYHVIPADEPGEGEVEHINGYFYRLKPKKGFELPPGESCTIPYTMRGAMIRRDDPPCGILYFVFDEGKPTQSIEKIANFTRTPFTRPDQMNRGNYDQLPLVTPEYQYELNKSMNGGGHAVCGEKLFPMIPRPVNITTKNGDCSLSSKTEIVYEPSLQNEAEYLAGEFQTRFGLDLSIREGTETGKNIISLGFAEEKILDSDKEAYRLSASPGNGVKIQGTDAAGVFYGIQSLLALLPAKIEPQENLVIKIPGREIEDAPRFHHRGFHLDVARHFHDKETICKVLDILSTYKVNSLKLRLSDDEGWRLEIDGLPELTQVGSRRGHTLDGHDFLQPAFGSGPDPDDPTVYAHGYFSKADYMDILKYAKKRHVGIVPEICFPSHARAAMVAMESRYDRLMKEGKTEEALEYRLTDPEDKSEYYSAQMFRDNIACIGYDSTLHFYKKVVQEIQKMHDEAGVPLEFFHLGGDELPEGAWLNSPACQPLVDAMDGPKTTKLLSVDFFWKMLMMLKELGITKVGGWEEVCLTPDENGKMIPNPKFLNQGAIPSIWNSLWGDEDMAYRFTNAGFDVILCNVTNFYFDLCYEKHPDEPGLNWGGYVSARSTFEFEPFNLLRSVRFDDPIGTPFVEKEHPEMARLNPEMKQHILGIEALIWSETISEKERIELFLQPRLLAFAENTWGGHRCWELIEDDAERQAALQTDWLAFLSTVGLRELDRLDRLFGGVLYRISPPGAVIKDGMLFVNEEFPGLTIRYTVDGTEPDLHSPVYQKPIRVQGTVKLKAFNNTGHGSRTVSVP